MRVLVFSSLFLLLLFYSSAKKRNKVSWKRKTPQDLRKRYRELDINTIVMPRRDFETVVSTQRFIFSTFGRSEEMQQLRENSEVQSFHRNRRI